ncbi:hypothetical protein LR48_Vigan585s000900 [Vigna angularis]|uniref:PFU domain-containing protein n=1 Tax=Phaseolus angularis TaxID=3914 RepID=A0A0L9TE34_PHAAN|nr:hypothetical protein LR48_Vigan585s000900 [Vigna angularis]
MLKEYLHLLDLFNFARKRVGGLKLEELPGLEALKIPGSTDGQTKIVREGDNGVAYGWNKREQKWDEIGEVVDGPEESNRQLFDGIQYDYVFDVDIGDGMPIRKLPYNRSETRMKAGSESAGTGCLTFSDPKVTVHNKSL